SDITLVDATPTTLQEFAYSDNPSGAVSEETDTPSSSLDPAEYTYDAQNRVTGMTLGSSSSHSYDFDASGNLTTLPNATSATSYDNASELTSATLSAVTTNYTYDDDGNRTHHPYWWQFQHPGLHVRSHRQRTAPAHGLRQRLHLWPREHASRTNRPQ